VRSSYFILLLFENMWVLPAMTMNRWLTKRPAPFAATFIAHFNINWWGSRAQGHTTISTLASTLFLDDLLRFLSEFLPSALVSIFAIHVRVSIIVRVAVGRFVA